jgi:hypothetical protein
LTWSETSAKRIRPLKDLVSWETVSIARARSLHAAGLSRN